jgi:prophage DNA circulation protein
MADKLSKNLRPASFRGVPFQVDSTDVGAGRRTQVHEYPQRDKPWVEDLGRSAREMAFEAFVVGADYVDQANRLLSAIEESGAGALIHPWFGTLTVSLKDLARVTFNRELGFARFSLSFVESGELTFPAVGAATASQSRLAAAKIETAAVADFAKKFNVDGHQDFVAEDASTAIANAVTQVASGQVPGLSALGYAERSAGAISTAQGLLTSPASLGSSLAGFVGVSDYAQAGLRWYTVAQALTRLAQVAGLGVTQAPSVYTPSRQQSYVNVSAINALNRQVLLAQAVGVSSLVSADVYDDTIGLRNNLTAALDAESLNASDSTYEALQDARSAVWQDLTSRSRDGARLTTTTPVDTMPALVLAYDLYEDAERATDIVARNSLRHPGFVPPVPLRVLTR